MTDDIETFPARGRGETGRVPPVHLVGAGPGDPDLLTVRAARLLAAAEVVIHDRLVDARILDLASPSARRIDVGKAADGGGAAQARINALMVFHARAGRRVVRLKGGDPFVFGRGGEEVEHLHAAGVEAVVVPGITAASGCAASARIPLTHRAISSAVTLVTGHGREGGDDPGWAALARLEHTLVVYMGVGAAGRIAARLMAGGRTPSTPVAIIENGTRPEERVVRGRLDGLAALIATHAIRNPALIVIGDVAAVETREIERIAAAA